MVSLDVVSALEARLAEASVPPVDPRQRIDALNALAWELRSKQVPRAHELASEARQLAAQHEYTLGQARATRTLAMTLRDREALGTIFQLAEEAKQLFDAAGDATGRAGSRDFLASLYEYVGDLAAGLELALEASSIARELGDPVRQGYALSSVGGILAASGEVGPALERLREALALFEGVPDMPGVITICSRLCKVLEEAGNKAEALEYAEKCRAAAELTDDEYGRWSALTVLARIEAERGQLDEAERLYRDALGSWSSQLGRDLFGAETQIALGRLLLERGAHAQAERELNDSLERIVGNAVSVRIEADAHEALADLCERRGSLAKALQHLRQAHELRRKIAQQDARNKLAQVEVRSALEAARKDAEIHKLRFEELHGMQAQLVEAEKMALLGNLAAGMTHELNTPLGVLRSNAQLTAKATERLVSLLQSRDEQLGELCEPALRITSALEACATTSEQATLRLEAIAENIRRFTQLDRAELRAYDVRQGLESAIALLQPTLPRGIRLERSFDDVSPVVGWPRELNQAFLTVLENAAQAIDGEGQISVQVRQAGEHVLVAVSDTGRGMSDEQARHLFDFTWSQDGARTKMRLGLSAVHTTIQKHGGDISVDSAPGRGTTLTFRFPLRGRAPRGG